MPALQNAALDLMEAAYLLGKEYELYLDNWYISTILFYILMAYKMNTVGTVRANRKFMLSDFPAKKKSMKS